MKLSELVDLFKWPYYVLEVRAETGRDAISAVWRGNMPDFRKKDPVNESPFAKAKDTHLGSYRVTEVEANDGEEDLITVYIKGRSQSEFWEEE